MDRVSSIDKFIFQKDMVFMEIIEKKKGIIEIANGDKPKGDYCVIVAKGDDVMFNIGDIVLVFDPNRAQVYDYKGKKYILISQFSLPIVVKPENFNPEQPVKSIILS